MKTMILGICLATVGCRSATPPAERPAVAPPATPIAPTWKIRFANPTEPPEDSGRPASVYVTIEKDTPEFGLVKVARIHYEGNRIGVWMEGERGPTPLHRTASTKLGRMVEVDFDTKCVLRKLTFQKKVAYTFERCTMEAGPAGMVCSGKKTVSDTFTTNEILYTDADERPITVHLGGVRKPDHLCADHGGPK